jgi:transposase-like protein
LSLVLELAAGFSFYNLINCPACGNKLNRFKNGKRVPRKQAYTQLQAGHGCRHCGWSPAAGA